MMRGSGATVCVDRRVPVIGIPPAWQKSATDWFGALSVVLNQATCFCQPTTTNIHSYSSDSAVRSRQRAA